MTKSTSWIKHFSNKYPMGGDHRMTGTLAWPKKAAQLVLGLALSVGAVTAAYSQAGWLPPAKQQFFDDLGNPVAGGTVDMYVPNTTTRKNTYQNQAGSITNTNPINLDAAGRAPGSSGIYGIGSYRQIVKDSLGNQIWDATTTALSAGGGSGGLNWIDVTAPPYNARFDGATDDTAAIQAALDAARGNGQTVYVPCPLSGNNQTGIISATLVMGPGTNFVTCRGGSNQGQVTYVGTILKWIGTTNIPMVQMLGVYRSSVQGFTLDCNSVSGCIGLQYASANNPSSSYNEVTDLTVINAHIGFVVGDPSNTLPPITPPNTTPLCVTFSNLNCAQADNLTVTRYNFVGNGTDTSAVAVHVNDANGNQSSHWYQGNFQFVSVGFDIIWNNGGWTVEGFNGGNPVGEKTLFKFGQYSFYPPTLVNNETEGNWSYAVRSLQDTGEGAGPLYYYPLVMTYNQWNNPVSCEGNARILSIGNVGGGAGNDWIAGGFCRVVSQLEPTNQGTTRATPWVEQAGGQVTTWSMVSGQSWFQASNIVAGTPPTGMPIGSGNLAASATGVTDQGRLTLGSDGTMYLQRLGVNIAVNGGSFGVGTVPSALSSGDLYSSRSATAGALLLGSDGAKYIYRQADDISVFGARLRVMQNQASAPLALNATSLQVLGPNGGDSRMEVDAYGGGAFYSLVRSNGTAASPTTLATNDGSALSFHGYDGSSVSSNPNASVYMRAGGTWSPTSHPTYLDFTTTPVGSTTEGTVCRFGSDKSITCPPNVTGGSKGAGTINAAGLYVNGTTVSVASGLTVGTTAITGGTPGYLLQDNSGTLSELQYVNGSWTPTLAFGGATTGIAYTVQGGSYVRVGRYVFATGKIILSSKGSATGIATISGVPVPSNTTSAGGNIAYYNGYSGLTGVINLGLNVAATDVISVTQTSATGSANLTDAAFTNTSRLDFSISYISN